MRVEWNATENLRLPVWEAKRNGIVLASICFAGGNEPWEIQMHLPGARLRQRETYHATIEGAHARVQQAIDEWFEKVLTSVSST